MASYTRSEFLSMAGTLAAGLVPGRDTPPQTQAARDLDPGRADLLLINARVHTVDAARPQAEAIGVRAGRFIAVGSTTEISGLRGPRTEIIDAGGATVVPGFIDAHTHPAWGGAEELVSVNCDLRSLAEIKGALRTRAGRTPPGEWVRGFKYDDGKVRDGRRLRREDLDEAVPNHPVVVKHRGGHLRWYNSLAFEKAGITVNTPDPPGGEFVRRDGQLDGCVKETANAAFNEVLPPGGTPEQRRDGVILMSRLMTAAGITSVHEVECTPEFLAGYADAYRAGELRFRVYVLVQGYAPIHNLLKQAGFRGAIGDEWLRIAGVKYLADGSAQERTMRMSTPYVGRPNDYGMLTMTQEEIDEAAVDAERHGFHIGIHANGDVAIDMVLKAYERVKASHPARSYRPRIEHCSLVTPELLARIRAVGAIPLPFYTYVYYHGDKWGHYGAEKMESMFAHASFLQYGIPVAGASDYIPGPYEPMMAIQSMVTRRDLEGRVWGASQRISVAQALRVCTLHGAYASYEEDVKGSIAPGKYADFVLLERDPHDTPEDEIKDIRIVRTVVGGRTVHPAT